MTRPPLTATTTGQPDVDFAADLAVPLLLAQLAADESRRPSIKIVTNRADLASDQSLPELR